MVVFTCNNCGDSVKKPAVEKHYNTKCRGQNINVSCMDCQKDFLGDEHVKHTKCISEAEKYSAKGFVQKESKNKNAKKQDSWINVVHSILENTEYKMHARTREAFQRLQAHENVPRKQAKFENFATKCLRMNKNVVGDVWSVLEKELKKMAEARQKELEAAKATKPESTVVNENTAVAETDKTSKKKKKRKATEEMQNGENGKVETEEPVKKKKKKTANENEETIQNDTTEMGKKKKKLETLPQKINDTAEEENEEFKWQESLEKCIKKTGDHGIDISKLKSKILKKYQNKLGLEEFTEKQQKKFDKKFTKHLKKCTNISVENDVAKIC